MQNNKYLKGALALIGVVLIILGIVILIECLSAPGPDINAVDIENIIIIPIAGLVILGIAILMHLEKIKSTDISLYLKKLVFFWIGLAAISSIFILVLNIVF